jgi:hypothetical protein
MRLVLVLCIALAGCPKRGPSTDAASEVDAHAPIALTTGRIAGLIEVVVDADAFVDALQPAARTPALGALPADVFPAIGVEVDGASLHELGIEIDQVLSAVQLSNGGSAALQWVPTDGAAGWVFYPAPATDEARAVALGVLVQAEVTEEVPLSELVTAAVLDTLPKGIGALVKVDTGPAIESVTTWAPDPSAAPPAPTGTLSIANSTRAPVEVQVNATLIGTLGPLGTANITELATGSYDVTLIDVGGNSTTARVATIP